MRSRLALAALAATLAAVPAQAAAKGFSLGVAASDIKSSSAILWTRADVSGAVTVLVSSAGSSGGTFQALPPVTASAAHDNTVRVTVKHLKPGRTYTYQFVQEGGRKSTGTFETPPRGSSTRAIRFAVSGDADAARAKGQGNIFYNGLKGNNGLGAMSFGVYRQMALEHNDFNVNLGDTIYSDSEVPGHPLARTVAAKRRKYRLNLAVKSLRQLRASTGVYNQWDDHEFVNDFTKPENGPKIYRAGVKAFREFMPVHYSKQKGDYTHQRWGRNLEVFRLDERSFRSAKASAHHTCDNPQTHQPDLAPTAPQNIRTAFAAVVPSFSSPVPPKCTKRIDSPKRTFLGVAQRQRFLKDVKASKARFKIVINELPIQQFYALPYDRWEGYEHERKLVLHGLQDAGVKNVVWLATDVHANLVNVVRYKTLEKGAPQDSPYSEFVTGPVSTMTFAREINQATGGDNAGAVDAFFGVPPPTGPGMPCSNLDVYSYAEVKVTSASMVVTAKDVKGQVVKDQSSGTPCVLTVPAT